MIENVRITQMPQLDDAVLIAAFAGWNDASDVATSAVRFLVREWAATKFATIEPDEFYVFTETRPRVRLTPSGGRRIDWISNDFWFTPGGARRRPAVLLVGTEPQLRWRGFVRTVLDVARSTNVTTVITIGGLLADVPHTVAPRITGSSNKLQLTERLGHLGIHGSRYEGPTGIVGVLNSVAGQEGLTTVSMWGNVPHYISASLNPKVSGALLTKLDALLDLGLDLREWDAMSHRFDAEIEEAIARNPEVASYVRELEARQQVEEPPAEPTTPSELPDAASIVRELEDFLRSSNGDEEDSS